MGNENSQNVVYGDRLQNNVELSWKKMKPCPYPNREGQCACSHGNDLYIFGGVIQSNSEEPVESNDLLVYNTEKNSWSQVKATGSIPPACSAAALVCVGRKLYLFGGLSHDHGWFNELHVFCLENKSWSKLEGEGMKPSPRDKLQAVAVSTDIYFFGGFGPKSESLDEEMDSEEEEAEGGADFGWFNDLYIYNTVENKWSQPVQMNLGVPTARAAHAMCAVDRNLIIFGGRDAESRQNDLHIFNIDTKKWNTELSVRGRQPEPRSFHTATSVGNRVVVMGGRAIDNNHFADLHLLDTVPKHGQLTHYIGDEDGINNCVACQATNHDNSTLCEPLQMSDLPRAPWTEVSADFCGHTTLATR
ncbi:hypothetical protein ScPMuIL_017656 [Solemya velum]